MTSRLSRREFIKRSAALSALGAGSGLALDLAAMSAAAATSGAAGPEDDYRALVCLFLFGGNDHCNLLVPDDPGTYAEYAAARGALALPAESLASTSLGPVAAQGGRSFALHPSLPTLHRLYAAGDAALLGNVGALMVPTSKPQFEACSVPLPAGLFSHSDQQAAWQSMTPGRETMPYGWAGALGDLLAEGNTEAAFTAVSVSGNALWLSGRSVRQFRVAATGPVRMTGLHEPLFGSSVASALLGEMLTGESPHLLEQHLGSLNQRSLDLNETLASVIAPAEALTTPLPVDNDLAAQLNVVARIIAARQPLGIRRQVFFVSIGGFDHHDRLVSTQAALLGQVDSAIEAFWGWLGELGMRPNVALFSASDFGRTLTSNGDGSDHGWGAHHFVVGGGVAGGTVYGEVPPAAEGTTVDVGRGALLPTTAVAQYAATLGHWLGVPDAAMDLVLPDLAAFDARRLPLLG